MMLSKEPIFRSHKTQLLTFPQAHTRNFWLNGFENLFMLDWQNVSGYIIAINKTMKQLQGATATLLVNC